MTFRGFGGVHPTTPLVLDPLDDLVHPLMAGLHDPDHQQVDECERRQLLPAEVHELVHAVARQRPPEPHHQENQAEALAGEPEAALEHAPGAFGQEEAQVLRLPMRAAHRGVEHPQAGAEDEADHAVDAPPLPAVAQDAQGAAADDER
jgi:hypothetical protein